MKKILLLLVLLLLPPSCAIAGTTGQPAVCDGIKTPEDLSILLDPDKEKEIRESMSQLQLPFVRNDGQVDDEQVRFYTDTCTGTAFVTDEGVTYASANGQDGWTVRETFAGAKATRVTGVMASESRVNYFIGDNKNKWCADIPTYDKVTYPNLYKGIDLTLKAYGKKVEKIFTVYPGGNPADIAVQVDCAGEISVNNTGELEIKTCAGFMKITAPVAYQEVGGEKVSVEVAYDLRGGLYRFRLGNYDHSCPLVIDPLIVPCFSTYLGGTGNDYAKAIAIDPSGNIYIAGYTLSTNFPTANPFQGSYRGNGDAFVAKLNPSGTGLVYSTYLGGNSWDQASAIAVDSSGNAYVAGYTLSTNFPTANPYQGLNKGNGDAFVAKLNPAGNGLVYSTYIGGSNIDNAYALAIDSSGNAYLTGYTQSTDFPTVSPCQASNRGTLDAFVAKLNSTGNVLIYSTYLGGITDDVSFAITVDSSGYTYVAGYTLSTNFPTANPYQVSTGGSYDAFIAKLNQSGSGLVYSTYLGGNGFDQANAIAVDSSGNTYVAGWTASTNFPVASPCQGSNGGGQDAFVAKLNPSGDGLVYSTYLGGDNDDRAYALAIEPSGSTYITGYTGSGDFPVASPCQASNGGGQDAFAAKLNPPGSGLLYSTYLGGNSDDNAYVIAVDSSGNIYVAGYTASTDFPTTSPYQASNRGSHDAFVTKLIPASSNANLSNLIPSTGTLNPVFAPGITSYNANVSNAVPGITVTPTVSDATATVKVNGSAVASGSASNPIGLNVGTNTITIVVTAQDGITTNTYNITVTRTPSSNADLSGLTLSAGTLVPVFDSSTTSYMTDVGNAIISITFTPIVSDATATVKVNGFVVASDSVSDPVSLNFGVNTISIVVTAQDGITVNTYTITVNRTGGNNADLSSLVLSTGVLNPSFTPDNTNYTASVANNISSITVTPAASDLANAMVYINSALVVSGCASAPITLNVGANTVTTMVYARDGTITKTYTVFVNRAGSGNADLSDLVLSAEGQTVTLSPAFNPAGTSYSAGVTNSVTSVSVTPTLSDSIHAMVYVNGSLSTSGNASGTITLSPGANTVTTTVYAQDGTVKSYTITVNRLQDTTGPVVLNTDPVNGATGISVNKIIVISFSQNIQAGSNFADITLRKDSTALGYAGTISGNILNITPPANLEYNSAYTLTIPAGAVNNLSDIGLAADYIFNFTTIINPIGSSVTTSSSSQVLIPMPNAVIKCGTFEITLPVIFNSSVGNARVNLSSIMLINIFNNTHSDPNGINTVEVIIPEIEGATSYTLSIAEKAFVSETTGARVRISTCLGDVTVPGNMLNGAGIDNAVNPGITIGQGDKFRLNEKARHTIGDRPLIQLTLTLNDKPTPWSNPSAPTTVSIPYKPAAEELKDPEHITVWYIDGNGNVVSVPSGGYDPVTGKVAFNTTHFSNYAVVYVNKAFLDMDNYVWAKNPVEVLASKGVINGTSETTFSPAAGITRADFLLSLVKTLDLTAEFNANFDDVKQGDYYYEAVGTARKLGIAVGSGNNSFNPNDGISRQDMMALAERALRMVKKIIATGTFADLYKYEDKSEISGYAINSIAALVNEGLITGDRRMINPSGSATRAEAAVLIYRIYNK